MLEYETQQSVLQLLEYAEALASVHSRNSTLYHLQGLNICWIDR